MFPRFRVREGSRARRQERSPLKILFLQFPRSFGGGIRSFSLEHNSGCAGEGAWRSPCDAGLHPFPPHPTPPLISQSFLLLLCSHRARSSDTTTPSTFGLPPAAGGPILPTGGTICGTLLRAYGYDQPRLRLARFKHPERARVCVRKLHLGEVHQLSHGPSRRADRFPSRERLAHSHTRPLTL